MEHGWRVSAGRVRVGSAEGSAEGSLSTKRSMRAQFSGVADAIELEDSTAFKNLSRKPETAAPCVCLCVCVCACARAVASYKTSSSQYVPIKLSVQTRWGVGKRPGNPLNRKVVEEVCQIPGSTVYINKCTRNVGWTGPRGCV